MKKGKDNKKDEVIDISTLPKINYVTNLIILNFKNHSLNQERRFKILESLFKTTHKLIKLICRENIIDFAKEKEIFKETEHRKDINNEELAKAASAIFLDRSIQPMKDKKALQELIETTKKQKEEAIITWNNNLNQPVDPKKKPDPKAPKIINPDEIIVPVLDESATELMIVLYNYPSTEAEYISFEKEKLAINMISIYNDKDEIIVETENKDPKAKKEAPKEAKATPETLLMQKLFANPVADPSKIYQDLLNTRNISDKFSLMRLTCYEKNDFTYKYFEDTKKDTIILLQEELANKLEILSKNTLKYLHWSKNFFFQKLKETPNLYVDERVISDVLKKSNFTWKDFEHLSYGSYLFLLCSDIIKTYRQNFSLTKNNYENMDVNEIENIFSNFNLTIDHYYHRDDNRIESNMEMNLSNEINKVNSELLNNSEMSSPFNFIIDEKDFILKACIGNQLDMTDIAQKEKDLLLFRQFPGIGRYLMPELPMKEEFYRKAKKCEIYPFLTVGVPLYEKYEILKRYEVVFKEKIPEQNFDFSNRKYQEILDTNLLAQTLNQSLLYDQETLIHYNDRDDNLLFSSYYRCPKGRIYRKVSKYRYLSKHDFESWKRLIQPKLEPPPKLQVKESIVQQVISPVVIDPKDIKKEEKKDDKKTVPQPNVQPKIEPNVVPVETVIPPKIVPQKPVEEYKHELLYEADDLNLGEIVDKTKYMFPSDNAVIIKKLIKNGIYHSTTNYAIKDNLLMGIRENSSKIVELWIRFENDVTMLVNYIGDYNPNAEKYDKSNGASLTINYKNGLVVQILPDGDICQKNYDFNDEKLTEDEMYRIITSKASVLRYFPMDKQQIMYSNANVCTIQNGLSINTNNKGYRVAKRLSDNFEYEMDQVPITIQSDPESNTKTLIRDDKVMCIKYPEDPEFNSSLVIHSDETRTYSIHYKKEPKIKYIIEHNGYASTEILYDLVKKRTQKIISEGSSEAFLGTDDLMTRSFDGRLSKVILPDNTLVYTYKEKKATQEYNIYNFNTITLVYRPDGTVIKVSQDGEVIIITAEEREKMNMKGQNLELGKDIDFFFELNGNPEDRKGGVYTADLKKNKIWTKDDESNIFEIHSDGTAKSKLSVSLDLDLPKNIDDLRPSSPKFETSTFIDPENDFLEAPKNFIHPRLFVIENDNTGYELLNEAQVKHFKLLKDKNPHSKYYKNEYNEHFLSHYWFTKHFTTSEHIAQTHVINNIKIPKKLEKIAQTPEALNFPDKKIYFFRNLIESQEFDQAFKDKIAFSLANRDSWLKKTEKARNEFASIDAQKLTDLDEAKKIQKRILEERQKKEEKVDYDTLLSNISKDNLNIKIPVNESILFDLVGYINEKDKKKIVEETDFRKLPLDFEHQRVDEILSIIYDKNNNKKRKKQNYVVDNQSKEIKFYDNFWMTKIGKEFLQANPSQPYVKKAKKKNHQDNQEEEEHKDELFSGDNNSNSMKQLTPIVYLEDEKQENMKSDTIKTKKKPIEIIPSYYLQEKQIIIQRDEESKRKAAEYVKKKTVEYDHKCSERKEPPNVPYLKTTFPEAEFNEDYISVEKMTDHRIKTSSLANRLYFNAPSINEIRKSGQHNFLLEALDKKKTYDEMMERLNLMITSELCDPNTKMLKIDPVKLDFGVLKIGQSYERFIEIRNDDNLTNRIQVRKSSENKFLQIEEFSAGKIAPGILKRILVIIEANQSMLGNFKDEIKIMTKSFIYKIPVTAVIMSPVEHDKLEEEYLRKNISVLHPFTRIHIPKKRKGENDANVNLPDLHKNSSDFNETKRHEDSFNSSKKNELLPKIKA